MRLKIGIVALVGAAGAAVPAGAATTVTVGGYTFPPFVDADAPHGGLTRGLIERLNAVQDEYTFKFEKTSPQRRYAGFRENEFDVMFFEMSAWGWNDKNVKYSAIGPVMTGGEVYVAKSSSVNGEQYFKRIKNKSLAAITGYHYGFANFRSDAGYLKKNFDITLSSNHETNLRLVRRGRADVAVVTKSYLQLFLQEHPKKTDVFTVSDKLDQTYRLHALVDGDTAAISKSAMKGLLHELDAEGKLQPLLKAFGIADQWVL